MSRSRFLPVGSALLALAICACVGLSVAGCGGGGGSSGGGSGGGGTTTTPVYDTAKYDTDKWG